MERLQYLNVLRKILWDDLENVVKPMTKNFIQMKDALTEMPCVLIHSKSTFVSRCIARKHIAHVFGHADVLHNKEKGTVVDADGISYLSFRDFLEIDMENVMQSSDKMVLPDMLRQFASQRSINGQRHVLLINSLDSMNTVLMHAMRKVFEGYSNNVYFIMTCRSLSKVTDEIKSRCIMISGKIDSLAITKTLVKKCRPDLIEFTEVIHKKAEGDVANAAIMLELPSPELFTGHLPYFIEKSVLDICRTKNQSDKEKKIREFCTKIGAACIPLPILGRKMIEFVQIRLPDCEETSDIVDMVALMEHKTIISNKSLFAMEMFIHDFVKCVYPLLS